MDKPKSLSVKDFLIRKMSIKLNTSEKTIDAVITHQFQAATQALLTNDSVEISGLGKFLFNKKKAVKRMELMLIQKEQLEKTLADDAASERKKNTAKAKLDSLNLAIEILKPKIETNEHQTDLRGVEE